MSDRYSQLVNLPVAGELAKRIGLPKPVALDRYTPGDPLVDGRVLLGGAGRVAGAVARVLAEADVDSATALLHELTAAALARGERLEELSVTRPSLEDVYLQLTEAVA